MTYHHNDPTVIDSLQQLVKLCKSMDIVISPWVRQQSALLIELLSEVNVTHNLTRHSSLESMTIGHFLDSFLLLKHIDTDDNKTLIDVGSGAGFPALPLAIARQRLSVTAIDCRLRKVQFIRKAARYLELENVTTLHGRAEDLPKSSSYRRAYDIVTARAVGSFEKVVHLTVPLVTSSGRVIIIRGARNYERDKRMVLKKLGLLGAIIVDEQLYRLPGYTNDFLQVVIQRT